MHPVASSVAGSTVPQDETSHGTSRRDRASASAQKVAHVSSATASR